MKSKRVEKVKETYRIGKVDLSVKIEEGYTRPIVLGKAHLSIEEAKDAIKALEFALERLDSEGLIPLE